jgi:dTDP-L-rhamnose 4-epimerase
MYAIAHYTGVNNLGTAVLLEALAERPVERLLVASSMSIYGEGLYRSASGRCVEDADRTLAQLEAHDWEPRGPGGEPLAPLPTPETKRPSLSSVYALSKYDQERLALMIGRAYGIPATALRFFNVYGPRQALSNPYTGVLAIFASRLLNGKPPLVFEDGLQRRDFVSVYDVARACRLALERDGIAGRVVNVGSGHAYTILEIAGRMAEAVGRPGIEAEVVGKYRAGDIRHCFADVTLARELLGFEPRVRLEDGLSDLAGWLEGQTAVDRAAQAGAELAARGLTL